MAFKNICWFGIGNTPGTAGNLTVGAAVDALHVTLGAADDGASYSARIYEAGVGSEVRTGCTYTHSTTTLTRGTLESSTSGSALDFTSAAKVQILGATAATSAQSSLELVAGPNAATTMAVGRLYVVDGSALTADRTYTLPATAKAGDRIGVLMSSASSSYEVILTAASGDTLNGVAGGTEWSRLFLLGETVTMICIADNATWMIERDGRIPQYAMMALTTNATGEAANTFVRPTNQSGAWTAHSDNASITTTSTGQIKTRRAGRFDLSCFGFSVSALGASKYFSVALYKNGTTDILFASTLGTPTGLAVGQQAGAANDSYPLNADDYIVYQYRSEEGSKGLTASSLPRVISWMSLKEIL